MFDRVTICVSDRDASMRFYDAVLPVIGIEAGHRDRERAVWGEFSIADGGPVTRRLHVGFAAPSREHVDAFWHAGVDAGYRSDGEPGPRPQYVADYYGSFLLDPDGNSIEAVKHGKMRGGMIDHLWLRVTDVEASARFYAAIAPNAGLRVERHAPHHAQVVGERSTFSLVAGEPTAHVHLAFPGDAAAVMRDPDGNTIEFVDHGR